MGCIIIPWASIRWLLDNILLGVLRMSNIIEPCVCCVLLVVWLGSVERNPCSQMSSGTGSSWLL